MIDYALSKQQIEVISALSSGANMTTAADQAGVHRNTIAYWRRNLLPFQHALSHAQYDRAMLYCEKNEELVDLAFKTIQEILADPKAPASVRLKAALAIVQAASTPPEPKKQVTLDIEKVKVVKHAEPTILTEDQNGHFVHNDAQTAPPAETPVDAPTPQPVHKDAQTIRPETQKSAPPKAATKAGRNEPCPCGSNLKYKRCCINKPRTHAGQA